MNTIIEFYLNKLNNYNEARYCVKKYRLINAE